MSSSRPLHDLLAAHIPAELFTSAYIPAIKPPEVNSAIFRISGIKNSALCNALVDGLQLSKYSSPTQQLSQKTEINSYVIVLANNRLPELMAELNRLNPSTSRDNITRLFVENSITRSQAIMGEIMSDIYDNQLGEKFQKQIDIIFGKMQPQTISDVIDLNERVSNLDKAYKQAMAPEKSANISSHSQAFNVMSQQNKLSGSMSSRETAEIKISHTQPTLEELLKKLIPRELFAERVIGRISFKPDSDCRIEGIKNSDVCKVLRDGLGLDGYGSLSSGLIAKPQYSNFYVITLAQRQLPNLTEKLLRLDPEKTQSKINDLMINQLAARSSSRLNEILDGIKRHKISGDITQTIAMMQASAEPKTLKEAIALDRKVDEVFINYESAKVPKAPGGPSH